MERHGHGTVQHQSVDLMTWFLADVLCVCCVKLGAAEEVCLGFHPDVIWEFKDGKVLLFLSSDAVTSQNFPLLN